MKLNEDVLTQAASWYVDLRMAQPDDDVHDAHRQWLAEDSRHYDAWKRVQRLQKKLAILPSDIQQDTFDKARHSRRQMIKTLTLVLTVGGAGGIAYKQQAFSSLMADYRTAVGERKTIELSDGSLVHLNTDTAIDVSYSDTIRAIRLRRGEILIETAKTSLAQDFVVITAQGTIKALGTRFQVRTNADQAWVGVTKHAVEVHALASKDTVKVQAGQAMNFTQQTHDVISLMPANTDAWMSGMLIVSNWRLDTFMSELSRYHKGLLRCDSAVANIRISGAFNVADTQMVLENLSSTLPVKVRYFTRYWAQVEAN